jgi:hypothetical protein
MQWLLILSQGGGCDYTIGCGYSHRTIEAKDEKSAHKAARKILQQEGYLYTGDFATAIDAVEMYPLAGDSTYLPVAKWRQEEADAEKAKAVKEAEKARRRQYKALKKEFEGNG